MLQNNPTLERLINELWNKFWSGGIANPLTAIEQITYLIFMKRIDDLDTKRIQEFNDGWLDAYTSVFDGVHTRIVKTVDENGKEVETSCEFSNNELRWSAFKQLPAEEMLALVQQYAFAFIKALNGGNSHFTKHMRNAVFIIPSASLLYEAISIIEAIFQEIERDAMEGGHTFQDIQGDVYEYLLSEIAQAGKNGQFRTPRHIIKLLVELVNPQLGNKVGDPACGTGGFLLGAYQYIVSSLDIEKKYAVTDEDGFVRSSTGALLNDEVKTALDSSFYGYDIDVTMVRLGLMNLMMHGIDDPLIDYTDTLSKKFNHAELGTYDVVLANPPFTGNLNKGEIDGETLSLGTTKTELLFIERIHTMLRNGGTAGIIIPQGVLFGTAKAFVEARKIMIEQSQLKAVVTMPSGVFKPYAGVATAILIFTKGGETDNVWFYEMKKDGYSLDDKRARKGESDLHTIIYEYREHCRKSAENVLPLESDRTVDSFFVPKAEIVDNGYDLSLNSYKEEVYEEIEYEAPSVILERLEEIEGEIQECLSQVRNLYA